MTNLFDDNNNKPDSDKSNVPRSNVPEFSVSEIAHSLKRTLEETYNRVRVRGELSRVSIPRSGHMYTTLKDDQSNLDAVCWKGVLAKQPIKPEEGMEVICTGKISSYPARSNYQLIIESMELAGEGALLKLLEERKKKLAAEGLFAEERKRAIPFLPRKIGVVTSPTGAVIRDILHRLNDRFPRHVMVWPVLVQGDGAAQQVAEAIRGFDALSADQKPDTLIVARGGGSLEDLMPFNEEVVVRAVAECSIPTISAVGHETDTTLCDYAADLRAPTPTGAAEMAVPVREQLQAQVLEDQKRLFNAVVRLGMEYRHRLDALTAKLGDPARLLETQTQRLDMAETKLSSAYSAFLNVKQNALVERAGRLTHPRHIIAQSKQNLKNQLGQLARIERTLFEKKEQDLATASRMLETLSYTRTLERGYAVVRDEEGHVLSRAGQIKPPQDMILEFYDDKNVKVTTGKKGTTGAVKKQKPSVSKEKAQDEQESLF